MANRGVITYLYGNLRNSALDFSWGTNKHRQNVGPKLSVALARRSPVYTPSAQGVFQMPLNHVDS